MKKIIALLLLIAGLIITVSAQKKTFLRIYDESGKKIAKGFFAGTTDSSLILIKDDSSITVAVSKIGTIKTKRSAGHTILICSAVGAVSMGILGAASGEAKKNDGTLGGVIHDAYSYSSSEGFVAGFFVGAAIGAGVGAIISLLKKSVTYKIDGKKENWLQTKSILDKMPVYKYTTIN